MTDWQLPAEKSIKAALVAFYRSLVLIGALSILGKAIVAILEKIL